LQAERSAIPRPDELLIERWDARDGHHLFIYPFEGRLVHEGLSALFAYRMAQLTPISFAFSCNDYGFELVSPDRAPVEQALEAGLLSTAHLLHDVVQSLNAAELARRQFREIARVAGLVFGGYPGQSKSVKQVQASSGLLYDVFVRYACATGAAGSFRATARSKSTGSRARATLEGHGTADRCRTANTAGLSTPR